MTERGFDPAAFYDLVGATAKERNALRQDLVRGLKDYYAAVFGYDRYGGETIFHLSERMGSPFVFGFAALRILHDRRISDASKLAVASRALDMAEYGADFGLPFGLFGILQFALERGRLSLLDLRYALVITAGEYTPFAGVEKAEYIDVFARLVALEAMPAPERAFWGHSLIARHQDQPGAVELIDLLMRRQDIPAEDRRELCQAWVNFRQPRIAVDVPDSDGTGRGDFVADHMPFWLAHAPSWPSHSMVRLSLVWLARLGEDPLELAQRYLAYRDTNAEQIHGAVADILSERHAEIPEAELKRLVEQGIGMSGSGPTRRRFYRLGTDLFGPEYLHRATEDAANSVRQWAVRQLQKKA